MAFSGNVWKQIRSITADELIRALERDGWELQPCKGALHPYRNPDRERIVIIHYHPRKTYGPGLLKALLADIGWTETDLKRLKLVK